MYWVCVRPFCSSLVPFQLFNWFHYHSVAPQPPSVSAFLPMLYSTHQKLNGKQASIIAASKSIQDWLISPCSASHASVTHCSVTLEFSQQFVVTIFQSYYSHARPDQTRSFQSISFQLKWFTKWFECSFNDRFLAGKQEIVGSAGERRHCCKTESVSCFLNRM